MLTRLECVRPLAVASALMFLPLSRASAADALLFFTNWSALLDPAAELVVRTAATAANTVPGPIEVTGYADPTGSTPANNLLSQLRAQLVRDELVVNGISPDRIHLSWKGPTEFADAPNESRRVIIHYGR